MGLGTKIIVKKLPIANKLLMLYGERGTSIGPSQKLFLYETVSKNVLIKKLTPEDAQTGFNKENVVDQKPERAINVTNEEEITKIAPIPS